MLTLRIGARQIKAIIKGLEAIAEEAVFYFTAYGLTVRAINPSCTSVVQVRLKGEEMEYYECEGEYTMGFVVDRIKAITKNLTANDTLQAESDGESITLLFNGMKKKVKPIRLDLVRQIEKLPEEGFTYHSQVPLKGAKDFIKTIGDTSFEVIVKENEGGYVFKWLHDKNEEPVVWEPEGEIIGEAPSVCSYSADLFHKALCSGSNKAELEVKGGTDLPIRLHWVDENNLNFTAIIAPQT